MPHAGLGFHVLRVPVRTNGAWRSSRGTEAKVSSRRRSDKVTTVVLVCRVRFLAQPHAIQKIGKLQVRERDQLSYPVRQVASLDMVPERTPWSPAENSKTPKARTIRKDPCDSKGYTHTHTEPHSGARIEGRLAALSRRT